MKKEKLLELLEVAKLASLEAGKSILEVYGSQNFAIESKEDHSPLTKADKAAHNVIMKFLESTHIPVLSEEGRDIPFDERRNWEYLWIVDPLDGTKEFIKRNGEFTVNIALVQQGSPLLGVVYAPVFDKLYYGGIGLESYVKQNGHIKLLKRTSGFTLDKGGCKVVASRSHLNKETQDFLKNLEEPQIVSMGSSLKFMLLAEGEADIYPRYAPTMEWDTAAAHAILVSLGFNVNDLESKPLRYNKQNLLNPYFCAQ